MTSFFPDLNIWLALSLRTHQHYSQAWNWLGGVPAGSRIAFARYTHLGMLRLLTNASVMGENVVTLKQAWAVYDRWLEDPRVEFYQEPKDLDAGIREATAPFGDRPASKWIGDCYLLAYAKQSDSALVTFDRALFDLALTQNCPAVIPR